MQKNEKWGGKRSNAGRKSRFNEKTVATRIPESWKLFVDECLAKEITVAELTSGGETTKLDAVKEVLKKWETEIVESNRQKKERWANAYKLIIELKVILQEE